MAATKDKPRFTLNIEAPANGRVKTATITVLDENRRIITTDTGNLMTATERKKIAGRLAGRLGVDKAKLEKALEEKWNEALTDRRRLLEQAAAGSAEAVAVECVTLLDASPKTISRPLRLLDGTAYAAAWVQLQRSKERSVDAVGNVTNHEPPLIVVEDVLAIVASDGKLYSDAGIPGASKLSELGLTVRLPSPLPPGKGWSGAGVKRFIVGERLDPAAVFRRVAAVVNGFIDFSRSLASQEEMCELTACYILSTYLLDAFHVVGYLWPNGERGTGKTSFLQVVVELAYLGQLILAGSSYACLRDLADYGATLAFDDAEAVMDTRRTDPDKRTLLLAGNRRGATVAVKELEGDRWVMRHIDTFCPRLFSAIRLPDEVLGSRSIIVPLVRSGDQRRAKANPMDPEDWPEDRRRLLDDLWALGVASLPALPAHDRAAAQAAHLTGRDLDSWRPILAVAHWLQHKHDETGLFDRLESLSAKYREQERGDFEEGDPTRILFRALLDLSKSPELDGTVKIRPADVAKTMNAIAEKEHLADADKPFTTARRVGWLLKRQRFKRPRDRSEKAKLWEITRLEVEQAAAAYGIDVNADGNGENGDETSISTAF